jgi:hypothetical protein
MKKKKILQKLNEFKEKNLIHLTSKTGINGKYYEGTYRVESHMELMFLIINLIKVSAVALEESERLSDQGIPNPKYNVMEVLRHVLQLIPLEEIEMIDKVSELIEEMNLEENTPGFNN